MSSYREFTYDDIAATFVDNSDTGELFRKLPNGEVPVRMTREDRNGRFVSAQVGFRYHMIVVTHVCFMLHEHRWPLPRHVIDHRDGDVFNCRWANLREATYQQSSMNRGDLPRRHSLADTGGLDRGVYRHRNRYRVQLSAGGKLVYLGSFATKEEANEVARKARAELHGEWSVEASRKPDPEG